MSDQECKDISNVFKCLESSSSAVVYKGLQDVRNKVLKSANGIQMFKENNGIKFLLRFIRKPNEKILDISLSVLANLCIEDSLKSEVGEENGLITHLLNIIGHMQRDSIIGRACRLIGNLATNQAIALKLHHKGAVLKLADTIQSKDASSATKHMAVRALRLLWEVENCRSDMLKDQAVRVVASLLSSKEDELLQAVLKALAKFTHCCNERCALQIQGDGKGFEELVASLKVCSKSELAVGVVLNLCLVPEVRPLLGTAGAVEAIISQCNGQDPQYFSSDVISVLCLLCRESVNRGKVRRGGGLELLLATLRSDAHPSLEARVLNAILHFIYDELGLQLLIKEGLVPVLVQKLSKVVEDHGDNHKKQSTERKTSNCSQSNHQHKRLRLSSSRDTSPSHWSPSNSDCDPLGLRPRDGPTTLQSGHWSPGSCRSMELSPDSLRAYSPPPSSSRFTPSPTSVSLLSPASPLSDAYSPVCGYSSDEEGKENSDDEGVAEIEAESDPETTSPCLNDKEDLQDIQEALSASLPPNAMSRHGVLESWCLLLLSRVSHMDVLVDDMVSTSTVDTLLQYYALVEPPHPRAARVLQRLTRNHLYLLPLLRAGFVLKVNARLTDRIHEECSRCSDLDSLGKALLSQLSVLAESGYGEGEIFHQLLRAARPIQSLLILSIPFIIRTKRLLNVMMKCDQSGLDLLLELVSDVGGDGLVDEAIESISRLALHVGVQSLSKHSANTRFKKACDCPPEKAKQETMREIIILELDDGVSVCANRDELCRESPVFSAMLSGGFRESGRERVLLKDVTEKTLATLLNLLSKSGCCQCLLNRNNTDFAFEVLKLADRFIMQRIVNQVAEWLLEQLAPDIAPMLYIRAQDLRHVLSLSEKISKETLKFALSSQLEKKKRFGMFSVILNSDYKQQFVEDVSHLVKLHLEKK